MAEKSLKPSNNCVVCKKSGQKCTSPSTSLHSFPSCPEKRQIWINRCGLTDQEILPFGKICSFHFEPTCFKPKLKRRILHRDAIPTIFVKDRVKKTNMPIKKNEAEPSVIKPINTYNINGKPKNCNKNEIPLQVNNIRDVSVKVIDFLCYTPDDILEISAKKISEGKCETCNVHYEALKEMNAIMRNSRNRRKKENEATALELRKQISSLQSKLETIEKAKIKKL